MRHPAVGIALVLALLSGFVLAELWSLGPAGSRSIQAVPSAQVEASAKSFYQGVNAYLADGDEEAVRETLHPRFVTHQSGGTATGDAEDFLAQLDSIRRFYPDLQLDADVTAVSSNAASVTLAWNSVERGEFAGIGIDPGDLIGRLDLVRIERGLIVERWSSAELAGDLDAYPALTIELPVAIDTLVARVRQISLEHDTESIRNQYGHLLLIDLSGRAFLEVIRPVVIPPVAWRMGREAVETPVAVGSETLLQLDAMDAVFLPAGTMFRMWNDGEEQVAFIALEFGPPVIREYVPNAPLLKDLQSTLWSGITLQGVGDRLTLSFGRAELLPEAVLASEMVEGLELTWVTDGAVEMAASGGEARVRAASGLRSELVDGHAVVEVWAAGAAGSGADVRYRAAGDGSATVWVFSIEAAPGEKREETTGSTPEPTPLPLRNVS